MPKVPQDNFEGYIQPHAAVEWDQTGAPYSPEYGDIYWNPTLGIEEKQHVFINANRLHERWNGTKSSFSILELGFGFGLNCLLAARLWQMSQPVDQDKAASSAKETSIKISSGTTTPILNFISVEKHPVTKTALRKAYDALEDKSLKLLSAHLIENYPETSRGSHLIWLTDNICLTLIIGEDVQALTELKQPVDAIFLDGFSPGKNERMWNTPLFSRLPALCHSATTLSTYSVSGGVRRGLKASGFTIQKTKGFGRKHEMLTASFSKSNTPIEPTRPPTKPIASKKIKQTRTRPHAIIIGSGIAGLACAKALLKRGYFIQVLDKANEATQGASAIGQLAVYPHISVNPDAFSIFSLSAFQYSLRENHAHTCSYIKTTNNNVEIERLKRISRYFPEHFVSYQTRGETGQLIYQKGAWLNVPEAYDSTLNQVELQTSKEVSDIQRADNAWRLLNSQGDIIGVASTVIFATGYSELDILDPLGLNPNRGQAIAIRLNSSHPQTEEDSSIVSTGKTLFPENRNGLRIFSGTNSRESISVAPDKNDTRVLGKALEDRIDVTFEIAAEQVGIRCTTRDRIPIVGAIPNWAALEGFCAENRHRKTVDDFTQYEEGLYVCTGFGAHAATHAPISGELIARQICGESRPTNWHRLLDPARFKLRDRNKPK